jgi:hypothetical protein
MPTLKQKDFGMARNDLLGEVSFKRADRAWAMPLGTIPASHASKRPEVVPSVVVADGRHAPGGTGSPQRPGINLSGLIKACDIRTDDVSCK